MASDAHPQLLDRVRVLGPAGGGALSEIGAVELAVVAGPGGRGTAWIADLRLQDLSAHAAPVVRAVARAAWLRSRGRARTTPAELVERVGRAAVVADRFL